MFKRKISMLTVLIFFVITLTGCTFNVTNNFNIPEEKKHFKLELFNDCKSEIYGYRVEYYLDGKPIGGMAGSNADESKLSSRYAFPVMFYENNFPENSDLSTFQFQVIVLDKEMNESEPTEMISLAAEFGESYDVWVSGSFENGFSVVME